MKKTRLKKKHRQCDSHSTRLIKLLGLKICRHSTVTSYSSSHSVGRTVNGPACTFFKEYNSYEANSFVQYHASEIVLYLTQKLSDSTITTSKSIASCFSERQLRGLSSCRNKAMGMLMLREYPLSLRGKLRSK